MLLCLTVDLRTIGISDSPIIVDQSPPVAGVVYDGDHLGVDLVYMKDNDKVIIINMSMQFSPFSMKIEPNKNTGISVRNNLFSANLYF